MSHARRSAGGPAVPARMPLFLGQGVPTGNPGDQRGVAFQIGALGILLGAVHQCRVSIAPINSYLWTDRYLSLCAFQGFRVGRLGEKA
jgi:hypothetical protein